MGSLTSHRPVHSHGESGLNVQSGHSKDLVVWLYGPSCALWGEKGLNFPLLSWIANLRPGTYGGIMRWL